MNHEQIVYENLMKIQKIDNLNWASFFEPQCGCLLLVGRPTTSQLIWDVPF